MEYFDELVKKYDDKSLLWCLGVGVLSVFATAIGLLLLIAIIYAILDWHEIYIWLGLGTDATTAESFRNRGFALAAIIGAILTTSGIALTIWGRVLTQKQTKQTQQQIELSMRANASERYENAAHMLGSSILAVRAAGCHALENLGLEYKDIAVQCLQLSLTFLNNLSYDETEITDARKVNEQRNLQTFTYKPTPYKADIQAAINGALNVYKHYNGKYLDIDFGNIIFPNHFWKNCTGLTLPNAIISGNLEKASIKFSNFEKASFRSANLVNARLFACRFEKANFIFADLSDSRLSLAKLAKANFSVAKLVKTNLYRADLRGASFENANLSGASMEKANLHRANMLNANLSRALLKDAENLTKEQILSAKWGDYEMDDKTEPSPPELPEELLRDLEIQEWLDKPNYISFERRTEVKMQLRKKAKGKSRKTKAKAKKAKARKPR